MGKRQLSNVDGLAMRKRRRVVLEPATFEDVTTARQLRQLLTFTQDLRQARHGLQSFKLFLDTWTSEAGSSPHHLEILKEYLDAVKPSQSTSTTDEDAICYLSDIMDTWSFAVESRNDDVMAVTAVVLCNLLRVLSDHLDLVPYGLGICNTLLSDRYHRLVGKNLSSDKSKSFIISPTLRLLREVVSFDGGAVAKRLFRARNSTLASLARNLEIKHLGEKAENESRSSVRTNAIRFFIACLRHLPADNKRELLMEKHVVSHLTFLIQTDPPYVLREMLDGLRKHVFADDSIPRDVKFRAFNTKTLVRCIALYLYKADGEGDELDGEQPVSDAVHDFLLYVTTDPAAGILYNSRGLYPKGMEEEEQHSQKQQLETGIGKASSHLGGSFLIDKYKDDVPVFNFVLSEFIQKLRPWSSSKQSELLVAIFHAAPELISNYFVTNKAFSFEPKLSMTWIGYAAFLFSTVSVPLPAYFGARAGYSRVPPPTSVLLDNIMPLPVNQKVLSRCLAQDASLASFFATRLLIVSIGKLKLALEMHRDAASASAAAVPWDDAGRRLVDEFCQRIPDMKDVMRAYKAVPEDNLLHREAISRLLLLYYEIIPQAALVLNLDVSQAVATSLQRLSSLSEPSSADAALRQMELENLVAIASHSPGMRWFAQAESLAVSPFTALLRLWNRADGQQLSRASLGDVLEFVAVENQVVLPCSRLGPLLKSISPDLEESVWRFIDHCIGRCASSPIKYHELLQTLTAEAANGDATPVSLLVIAMLDQLPFVLKDDGKDSHAALAGFLWKFATNSQRENAALLELVWKKMAAILPSSFAKQHASLGPRPPTQVETTTTEQITKETSIPTTLPLLSDEQLQETLDTPVLNADDTSALTKWTLKAADELVEDGYATKLVRLLLSPHTSIRKEALTNIAKMASKIRESASYEEKDQVWLLLSELAESSCALVNDGPAPTFFVAFAIHALDVLKDPLHPLYAKVNRSLTKGPVWVADRVPMAADIFHGEPCEDDRYYQEMSWLLTYLLDGLATTADLTTYHNRRLFEKLLVLGGNPYLRVGLRTKLLRVVYRATTIASGSGTLATRFGIFSWLEAREALANAECASASGGTGSAGEDGAKPSGEGLVCEALRRRVWDTCEQSRISEWSLGGVARLVERGQ